MDKWSEFDDFDQRTTGHCVGDETGFDDYYTVVDLDTQEIRFNTETIMYRLLSNALRNRVDLRSVRTAPELFAIERRYGGLINAYIETYFRHQQAKSERSPHPNPAGLYRVK